MELHSDNNIPGHTLSCSDHAEILWNISPPLGQRPCHLHVGVRWRHPCSRWSCLSSRLRTNNEPKKKKWWTCPAVLEENGKYLNSHPFSIIFGLVDNRIKECRPSSLVINVTMKIDRGIFDSRSITAQRAPMDRRTFKLNFQLVSGGKKGWTVDFSRGTHSPCGQCSPLSSVRN